eukprot:m.29044 g.29044  ORF g.29044 m.29044 type:complete len:824 (-) comp8058_c0_seq1:806-3277(-)
MAEASLSSNNAANTSSLARRRGATQQGPPRCSHNFIVPGALLGTDLNTAADPKKTTTPMAEHESERGEEHLVPGIEILLIRARKLMACDSDGRSDPMVKMEIKGEAKAIKSSIVKKTTNPYWNELFFIPCKTLAGAKLSLELADSDGGLSRADYMGTATVNLNQGVLTKGYYKGRLDLHQVPIVDAKGKLKDANALGNLSLSLQRARGPAKACKLPLPPEKRNIVVVVDILRARNLSPKDSLAGQLDRLRDPMVKVRFGKSTRTTRVINRTLSPEWNERVEFMALKGMSHLQLQLYDYESLGGNLLLGTVDICLDDYEMEHTVEEWWDVKGMGKDAFIPVAEILLRITTCSMAPDNIDRTSAQWLKTLEKAPGVLNVEVKRARSVTAADGTFVATSSDPFAVVEVGKTRYRTSTDKRTLDPVWNRQFEMPVNDVFQVMKITIYDEDEEGKSDFLGKVEIPLLWIPEKADSYPQWFALKDIAGEKHAGGDLYLSASFSYKFPKCLVALKNPREVDMLEHAPDFKIKLLTNNIDRIKAVVMNNIKSLMIIPKLLNLDYGIVVGFLTGLVWTYITLYMELWHVPLMYSMVLLLRVWTIRAFRKKKSAFADVTEGSDDSSSSDDDVDDQAPTKKKKKKGGGGGGLFQKWRMILGIAEDANNKLSAVATLLERFKNLFLWKNFTASTVICLALTLATIVLYLVSGHLRNLVFLLGWAKLAAAAWKQNKSGFLVSLITTFFPAKKAPKPPKRTPTHRAGMKKGSQTGLLQYTPVPPAKLKGDPFMNMISRVPCDVTLEQRKKLRPRVGKWEQQKMREEYLKKMSADGML